jgi:uncharacterized coiled-coil protein SlyX
MLNQHSLSPQVVNDKRVDVLLKQQIFEHKAVIAAHHKEMQSLRDSLELAMQKFDSAFSHAQEQNKKDIETLNQSIFHLTNKTKAQDVIIDNQNKTISDLNQYIHNFYATYADKEELAKNKKDIHAILDASNKNHLSSFQDLQKVLKDFCKVLHEEFTEFKSDVDQEILSISDRVESKVSQSKIDCEAILKQIRVYEKSMFIIEKKIEHIYIQIKRINERGAVCHKPA